MIKYILKRLALIPVTLLGILLVNFVFVQLAPGGPVEQMMMKLDGQQTQATGRFSGSGQIRRSTVSESLRTRYDRNFL